MATKIEELSEKIDKLSAAIDLAGKKAEILNLQKESENPAFWQDHETAAKKMSQLSELQETVDKIEQLKTSLSDESKTDEVERELKKLELITFLAGKYDKESAIISIHAGQGGTEAMDWAQMLQRMYMRYAEKRGWKVEIVEMASGEEAGIKSVTFLVNGQYAYGYLKNEAGAHRLVRQSPFNAQKLRQTSFALVEVLPQLPDTEAVELREEDIEWQFFHASGHGGQNVQKVATAVRLTHKPTGLVVSAQTERFQEQNRKIALSLLSAKLWARAQEERANEQRELRGEYRPASWGNQIRSYVLHPYKMVKDLRTVVETGNTEVVLDGGLDEFISEEVKL
ncbi:peptide chain release factor 2 [Candidatus Microgenomates bacterium]|nr:peptide chain release factor 2 [Candidatus Microgenomates bacterium]